MEPGSQAFRVGDLAIGEGRCKVVAEIAQAHDGSLGTAHAYIDAVARAGADAVKFQTHIADAESTPSEPFRVKFSPQDETRYAYWKRMELTPDQWAGLYRHAGEKGLLFLSSAFSMEAVELLEKVGVRAWKVGAGEVTNTPMIERMARTAPVMLSSGMSTVSEIDRAVETVRAHGRGVAVLQCTTSYPCPPEKIGLNMIGELRSRYRCPVGLSDHSGTTYAGLAAAALGADLLEVHTVFSRECFGPDVTSSVTTSELADLVRGVRFIGTALAHPVEKDRMASDLSEMRRLFTKSVVAARDLSAGHRIAEADLALRKPGSGLPADRIPTLVGRRLRKDIPRLAQITEDAIE